MSDIDRLAREIRRVDETHTLAAEALAEALGPFIEAVRAEAQEATIQADADTLAAEIHEAWEFQYDECDHGTYSGGHLNGEPYAMCRLSAERIVRRRAADRIEKEAGIVNNHEYHDEDTLRKVYEALMAEGIYGQKATDLVSAMQNRGILFRERKAGVR